MSVTRRQFNHPTEAAAALIAGAASKAQGDNGSRYAQYRAAEVEAWAQCERQGNQGDAAAFWRMTAGIISSEYHSRDARQEERSAA